MTPDSRGWILYDGTCGFCSRWVPFWGPWLRRLGFGFRPLQDPWVMERTGLSVEELVKDLRLLLASGVMIQGADVYRHVLSVHPFTRPLAALTRLPLVRQLFEGGYRLFARNRYRVSAACGWKAPDPGMR